MIGGQENVPLATPIGSSVRVVAALGLLPRTVWGGRVPTTLEPGPSEGIAVCATGRDTDRHVFTGGLPGAIGRMRSIRGCVEPTGAYAW